MNLERRKLIREAVLHDMAPAYEGQVSLEDVNRAFRGRGDLKEIEECLNDLVKEGLATKTEVSGRSYYLFESIARDAVSRNERRLGEVENELELLQKEIEGLEHLREEERFALDHIRPIWFGGWDKSGLEREALDRVQNYIAIAIDKPLQDHGREMTRLHARVTELKLEKERRLISKQESFITLPAAS